ncbi:kinase [Niveispirillum lacus]|uniref:Kinase n=1 Tax=Niveispirillum lacus TaxID=1981099 RepID=A0A255Z0A4_9PROT|nr:kinase [Niveispirillum lacus]
MSATAKRPLIMGLCGAQGSGKSTLSDSLAARLRVTGVRAAVLSLDDLYLTKAARQRLARDIHPLLAIRGVPGTHDVALGLSVLDNVARPGPTVLPRFDKSVDDRDAVGVIVDGPVDLLLLEGWCVGAVPQDNAALHHPVNELERVQDPDGRWRRYVNGRLAGDYQRLFARLDGLILLAAPDFAVVRDWRCQQEETLRARLRATGNPADQTMTDRQVAAFVQFYERLTRHILAEMPGRADLVLRLDAGRQVVED